MSRGRSARIAACRGCSCAFSGAHRPIGGSMPNSHGTDASAPRLAIHAPEPELDRSGADDSVMQVGLLGPLTLRRGSALITPSAPKLRQVLSLLVLQANSVTRVDQLVEELWEESPPPSALTTVQTYIYQLRKPLKLAARTPPPSGRR